MPNCLVVGFGRAGQRHAKIARARGFTVFTVDPNVEAHFLSIDTALVRVARYDVVVIATPPDCHLAQIAAIAPYANRVLCEKPLCGLDSYAEARALYRKLIKNRLEARVSVAYNYRYHPALINVNHPMAFAHMVNCPWQIVSENYRADMPSWGLLLDHVSHALDTMAFVAHGVFAINKVEHENNDDLEQWYIEGRTARDAFTISETLHKKPHPRSAILLGPAGAINIDANPIMFDDLWDAFLAGLNRSSLTEALNTQYWLQQVNDMERSQLWKT